MEKEYNSIKSRNSAIHLPLKEGVFLPQTKKINDILSEEDIEFFKLNNTEQKFADSKIYKNDNCTVLLDELKHEGETFYKVFFGYKN